MERTTYIHGTAPLEQERLASLNRLTNAAFVTFLEVPAGARVLEVGSGLGLLAVAVAEAAPEVRVVGLEQSRAQLAAAAANPSVRYVRGDAHQLNFADERFDLVYARYLLEHVPAPELVLSEMRRVVRVGGRVAACENDVGLMRVDPPCATFEHVWKAFQTYQAGLGGDSLIGRRLHRLFRMAGFEHVVLSVQPEVHWHGSPGFEPWVANIIGNIESAREGLVRAGLCDETTIGAAVTELTALIGNRNASSCFMWNRAVATRERR
jgi:SAM-dependent methyltransferase